MNMHIFNEYIWKMVYWKSKLSQFLYSFFLTDPNIRQPAFDWLCCSDQSESLQSNGAK